MSCPNPNGKSNCDVVRPWGNGEAFSTGRLNRWIIDFGVNLEEAKAALYERPFQYVLEKIKPKSNQGKWWIHERTRPELRKKIDELSIFYIATRRVAKHRIFVLLPKIALPDSRLYVITREDYTTLGILQSKIHSIWAKANRSDHGAGGHPTYNAKSCFETFPFPEGLTPNIHANDYVHDRHAQAIAKAAKQLAEYRETWLNPAEWVKPVPGVVHGYPGRLIPVDGKAAKELKKRTLTKLYNELPAWLDRAHKGLDEAVAAAYGWKTDISDDEILRRLLALNLERSNLKTEAAA